MNVAQLEFHGRYEMSLTCILTMQSCTPKFVINDEIRDIDSAEFALINNLISKHGMIIAGGDLQMLNNTLIPILPSDLPPRMTEEEADRIRSWSEWKKGEREKGKR